jgi:hypothetical protein
MSGDHVAERENAMDWKSLACAALCATLCTTAGAVGNAVDVTVYDRAEARVLPVYRHEGRYYVVGRPGNEYQIRVRNRAGADVLAVVSVDGVNAISGETAAWGQTGYVLGAGQSYDVKGWRKSLQRIAAFFFTEHAQSYAARTGRPDNVGVIGVAIFRRKAEPPARILREPSPESRREAPYEAARGDYADGPAPSADNAAAARQAPSSAERLGSLGTGHGRSEGSRVTYADFERATAGPEEVVTIHYDSYANLAALGLIPAPRLATPVPFPGQFVPDPR